MTLSYRALGVFWLIVGLVFGLTAVSYILAYNTINTFYYTNFPEVSKILSTFVFDLDKFAPGLQQIFGMIIAAFLFFYGTGLVRLDGWTRTVGVSLHVGVGACLIILSYMFNTIINSNTIILNMLPNWAPLFQLIAGITLGLFFIYIAIQLTQPSTLSIFSGKIELPIQYTQVICPTCGGQLDLVKEKCPKCDDESAAVSNIPKPRLIEPGRGKEFPVYTINRTTRIGRDNPGYEVQLIDPSVSYDHAEIECTDGYFYLHAHNDTNGTFVNGVQIRDQEIKHNDRLRFGRVEIIFLTRE